MKKAEKPTSKKEREIVPILGIGVDSTYKERALNRAWKMGVIREEYRSKKPSLIVTPNPEIILAGSKDSCLGAILNKADLAVPDGIGVVLAMRFLSLRAPKNPVLRPAVLLFQGLWIGLSLFINRKWLFEVSEAVSGRWLFKELVQKSAKEGKRVFLLGGKPGVAEKVAKKLGIKYRVLRIEYNSGPWLNEEGEPKNKTEAETEKETMKQINAFKPHFLFVGFGCPKQEKWLARFVLESRRDSNLIRLNAGAAMTVGGVFDYLAGAVPEPPKMFAQAGLEWLWRLITQPARIRRIFNAVVVFPLKIYLYKLCSRIQ